jgi:hypothetical protein
MLHCFLVVMVGSGLVMMHMNSCHESVDPMIHFQNQHLSVESLSSRRQQGKEPGRKEKQRTKSKSNSNGKDTRKSAESEAPNHENSEIMYQDQAHKIAGLDCSEYDGPSNEKAAEMVYWSDIPSDSAYISPFYDPNKYVTFEPDEAGWNNMRMSMETVIALAVSMGRTLVLPAPQRIEHLGSGGPSRFSFSDFYHLESISNEFAGINVITMEQFLREQAITGKLKDESGQVLFPPGNRVDWSSSKAQQDDELVEYLRSVSLMPDWDPETCLAAFPASKDPKDLKKLTDLRRKIEKGGWGEEYMRSDTYKMYIGKPNPVNASVEERAREMWAQRKTLCIYDKSMQEAPLIHFGVEYEYGEDSDDYTVVRGARLLVHFYAFLIHEDWRQELWMKRFVRDHLRYVDKIQCAAARVVNAVRERAQSHSPDGTCEYDAFHIRRGDFGDNFEETQLEADEIYEVSKAALTPNATVYIGTDERDKSFFKPLADHYDIVFLDDFIDLVHDVNSNFYGILDQLITSRSRVFFGCWFSTFTGYINRIRGYHSVKRRLPGYEDGALPSTYYYYAFKEHLRHMHKYVPVKKSFYAREFPAAWRDIDSSVSKVMVNS